MTKTPMIVTTFQRRLDMTVLPYVFTSLCIRGLDDRRMALQAADGGARNLDSDLRIVGDLQLDHLLVDFRDLAMNPARRDDPVVHLEAIEKLLHLLLLTLCRQQDDEVE